MKSFIPPRCDRYQFVRPQQPSPRMDATTVALAGFVVIVAWLAMIGFGTVIMWGLR